MPPSHPTLSQRDREKRVGMMVRKGEGKRKEAWEAGGQPFHVPVSSGLHSPDYIPFPWLDSFSNFSQPREDRLRRSSWLTALTHFGPPQFVWYPNPPLLTWQDEGVWYCLIGRSSCRSGRHLPSHLPLIMLPLFSFFCVKQLTKFKWTNWKFVFSCSFGFFSSSATQSDKERNWIGVYEEQMERGLLVRNTQTERSEYRGQGGWSGCSLDRGR